MLKDVHAIGKMNLTESVSADVLERVDRTMKQAVAEAGKALARLAARAGANRAANDEQARAIRRRRHSSFLSEWSY